MSQTLFWYDFETTGTNPRCDRPLQVAGLRTDEDLNIIGEPLNLYCRLADDILPNPAACLITGITPERLLREGLSEAAFMARLHSHLSHPGTCSAGYNTLRFDDEVTRHSLYRNFYDPYAREWQGGNTRWDLIDVLRAAYALRPDGIEWPQEGGRVTLKLERLTEANGLDHGQAHDALSDVQATIALARLIRERQPRLYHFLYQLRHKRSVLEHITLMKPLVHVSGRFSAERSFLSLVLPLAWHPRNRNALIVCDLHEDPVPLIELDVPTLHQRLYTRRDELAAGELPIPLKLIQINRCPVLAPLSVLREVDQERLSINLKLYKRRAAWLQDRKSLWKDKLSQLYQISRDAAHFDPEQRLYEGFICEQDRKLCDRIPKCEEAVLGHDSWVFNDSRLPELFFRYRARNFFHTLKTDEQERWTHFCRQRLSDAAMGAPNTLASFEESLHTLALTASEAQQALLESWRMHAQALRTRFQL
ncbi:exodeoxyribonuclease I subunit C [Pseudomonas duriflava]|uniref:Exodeoxyribonuclease I n=1 Tax=Pseudomonas duriflava TaxID=459528 RepID=A0A562QR29_9PSED|nr:exodeoxyribonuclease I [Pseudomonas duriflava]TWI58536.1 exodeoxyribonuclease I subunit C [Pseudomonas duriflava]